MISKPRINNGNYEIPFESSALASTSEIAL